MRICAWMTVWVALGCGHVFVEEGDSRPLDAGTDVPTVDARDAGVDQGLDAPSDSGRDAPPDVFDAAADIFPDVFDAPDVFDGGPSLVDRGLLVRFPMVFGVADAILSTSSLFGLGPRGPNTTLSRLDTVTGNALGFGQVSNDDGYCAPVGTGPVSMLNGSAQGTIEVVVSAVAVDPNASRFLEIGEAGRWGFSLGQNDSGNIIFSMSQSVLMYGRWPSPPLGDRHVLTAVLDSSRVNAADRLILYIDGVAQVNEGTGVDPGETIVILPTNSVCVGNSATGPRSPEGTIYYAAYYGRGLTAAEVMMNAEALLVNDDL